MARTIIYVEQTVLNLLAGMQDATFYQTNKYFYLPLEKRDEPLQEKIELVSSPRPVPREHLLRDFQSEINDLETIVRHLKYMKSEI